MSRRVLKIEFPDDELARQFASWLSDGGGEQGFMECAEDHDGRVVRFGYHGVEDERYAADDKRRYGEFLEDWTVRVYEEDSGTQ